MDFNKIIEYQKIDQEQAAIIRELKNTDEYNQYYHLSVKIKEAQDQMSKLISVAHEVTNEYQRLVDEVNGYQKEIKEYEGITEGVKEVDELNYYIKSMEQLAEGISQLEKKASVLKKRIEETNSNYNKLLQQGRIYNAKKHELLPLYKAKVEEYKPQQDALQKKLDELAKDIPEKILNVYNTLKQANKLPAFVEYDPNIPQCGRCFMELANDTRSKLKKPGDYVECPNCRRILYIPEK